MLGDVGQQCCVRFARGFSLRNVHDKTTRLASLLLLYKEDSSARIIGERAACKDDYIFIVINLPVSVNHMTDD